MRDRKLHYSLDKVVLLFLVGLLFFISPLLDWIFSPTKPWYVIYLVWLVFIFLIACLQHAKVKDSG